MYPPNVLIAPRLLDCVRPYVSSPHFIYPPLSCSIFHFSFVFPSLMLSLLLSHFCLVAPHVQASYQVWTAAGCLDRRLTQKFLGAKRDGRLDSMQMRKSRTDTGAASTRGFLSFPSCCLKRNETVHRRFIIAYQVSHADGNVDRFCYSFRFFSLITFIKKRKRKKQI